MLPTKEKIRQQALTFFCMQNPNEAGFSNTPEDYELKESGYWKDAIDYLMPNTNPEKTAQNEYVAYLGQEANSNGYRLVTKQEHNKIIQAERLKKEDKNHKHAIRQLNQQIDSMKPQPQPDPEPEVKTEFDVSEALKNGAYISGTTGSGKSDLAMYHAEAMIQAGVTVLVFDASQDWINRSSIPYYITIEPNVHFQYELNGKSIIFDMSLLSSKQQKDIVKKICVDVWNHQVRNSNRH